MEKYFLSYEPELATSKPNYDNRFGLKKDLNTVNNDYNYSEVEKSNHTRYFQKWRFKNRARFKRSLVSVFTLFVVSFASCGASDRPTEPPGERLPFGVFPLNDVKWVHVWYGGHWLFEPYTSGHINVISAFCIDTITYSVRQINETTAELRSVSVRTEQHRIGWDTINKISLNLDDTTYTLDEPAFSNFNSGWIYLENNRVYFRGKDYDGSPWPERNLMYDFNLNVGDTFLEYKYLENYYYKYSVKSIDRALVGNEYRKRYNFVISTHYSENYTTTSVIEGIGSPENLFHTLFYFPGMQVDPQPPELQEVYFRNKLIWKSSYYQGE